MLGNWRDWKALVGGLESRPDGNPLAVPPHRRVPLRSAALFAELESVRLAWNEIRSAPLSDHANRYVNADWNLRALLAHLASWARKFRSEVETVFCGETFDYAIPFALSVMGPTQWNEEQVDARRERSLEEILDELDSETVRVQELVLEMPEEVLNKSTTFPEAPSGDPEVRWRGTAALVVLAKCRHDRYHIAQIRQQIRPWS